MSVSRDRATSRTRTEGTVADAKSENIGLLWTFGDIVKPDYYYLNHNCSGGDDATFDAQSSFSQGTPTY